MESQRNWFPFILAGVTLMLTAAFIVVDNGTLGNMSFTSDRESTISSVPAATEASYTAAVTTILGAYATDRDAGAAYDALVLVRVPAASQALHFDLVVAFGKLASGSEEDGSARLAALKAQYAWLPL